jgi:hypothetical protein
MSRRSLIRAEQKSEPARPISKISSEKRKEANVMFYGDDDEESMEVTQTRNSAGYEILHVVFYGPDLGLRIDRSETSQNTAAVFAASKLAQRKGIGVGDEVISINNTDLSTFSFTETARWLRNAGRPMSLSFFKATRSPCSSGRGQPPPLNPYIQQLQQQHHHGPERLYAAPTAVLEVSLEWIFVPMPERTESQQAVLECFTLFLLHSRCHAELGLWRTLDSILHAPSIHDSLHSASTSGSGPDMMLRAELPWNLLQTGVYTHMLPGSPLHCSGVPSPAVRAELCSLLQQWHSIASPLLDTPRARLSTNRVVLDSDDSDDDGSCGGGEVDDTSGEAAEAKVREGCDTPRGIYSGKRRGSPGSSSDEVYCVVRRLVLEVQLRALIENVQSGLVHTIQRNGTWIDFTRCKLYRPLLQDLRDRVAAEKQEAEEDDFDEEGSVGSQGSGRSQGRDGKEEEALEAMRRQRRPGGAANSSKDGSSVRTNRKHWSYMQLLRSTHQDDLLGPGFRCHRPPKQPPRHPTLPVELREWERTVSKGGDSEGIGGLPPAKEIQTRGRVGAVLCALSFGPILAAPRATVSAAVSARHRSSPSSPHRSSPSSPRVANGKGGGGGGGGGGGASGGSSLASSGSSVDMPMPPRGSVRAATSGTGSGPSTPRKHGHTASNSTASNPPSGSSRKRRAPTVAVTHAHWSVEEDEVSKNEWEEQDEVSKEQLKKTRRRDQERTQLLKQLLPFLTPSGKRTILVNLGAGEKPPPPMGFNFACSTSEGLLYGACVTAYLPTEPMPHQQQQGNVEGVVEAEHSDGTSSDSGSSRSSRGSSMSSTSGASNLSVLTGKEKATSSTTSSDTVNYGSREEMQGNSIMFAAHGACILSKLPLMQSLRDRLSEVAPAYATAAAAAGFEDDIEGNKLDTKSRLQSQVQAKQHNRNSGPLHPHLLKLLLRPLSLGPLHPPLHTNEIVPTNAEEEATSREATGKKATVVVAASAIKEVDEGMAGKKGGGRIDEKGSEQPGKKEKAKGGAKGDVPPRRRSKGKRNLPPPLAIALGIMRGKPGGLQSMMDAGAGRLRSNSQEQSTDDGVPSPSVEYRRLSIGEWYGAAELSTATNTVLTTQRAAGDPSSPSNAPMLQPMYDPPALMLGTPGRTANLDMPSANLITVGASKIGIAKNKKKKTTTRILSMGESNIKTNPTGVAGVLEKMAAIARTGGGDRDTSKKGADDDGKEAPADEAANKYVRTAMSNCADGQWVRVLDELGGNGARPNPFQHQQRQPSLRLRPWSPSLVWLPLLDCPITPLLECLSPRDILRVHLRLLLEQKVLIISSRYTLLVAACEALLALQSPLPYCQVYAPVLPAELLENLHCPAPFLMGIHRDSESMLLTPQFAGAMNDVTIARLDEGTVTEPICGDDPLGMWGMQAPSPNSGAGASKSSARSVTTGAFGGMDQKPSLRRSRSRSASPGTSPLLSAARNATKAAAFGGALNADELTVEDLDLGLDMGESSNVYMEAMQLDGSHATVHITLQRQLVDLIHREPQDTAGYEPYEIPPGGRSRSGSTSSNKSDDGGGRRHARSISDNSARSTLSSAPHEGRGRRRSSSGERRPGDRRRSSSGDRIQSTSGNRTHHKRFLSATSVNISELHDLSASIDDQGLPSGPPAVAESPKRGASLDEHNQRLQQSSSSSSRKLRRSHSESSVQEEVEIPPEHALPPHRLEPCSITGRGGVSLDMRQQVSPRSQPERLTSAAVHGADVIVPLLFLLGPATVSCGDGATAGARAVLLLVSSFTSSSKMIPQHLLTRCVLSVESIFQHVGRRCHF